ncbi:MAG: hypothetical protein IPP17_14890 [Bacteroidetes bacterium]|nr:hypothetical protein [Bacteroidota bacterium]
MREVNGSGLATSGGVKTTGLLLTTLHFFQRNVGCCISVWLKSAIGIALTVPFHGEHVAVKMGVAGLVTVSCTVSSAQKPSPPATLIILRKDQ